MTPYMRKCGKKVKAKSLQNTTPVDGETSNESLMNAMRSMMAEMLAQKVQKEQPVSQPEKVTRVGDQTVMQKLSRFKKFAPPPFKEAKTPMEAEEWLDQLQKILDLL